MELNEIKKELNHQKDKNATFLAENERLKLMIGKSDKAKDNIEKRMASSSD